MMTDKPDTSIRNLFGERAERILAEQTIPPRFGLSPGMQAIAELKAFNALPPEEQQRAMAAFSDVTFVEACRMIDEYDALQVKRD